MAATRHCWKCGTEYQLSGTPGRSESCERCGADLKVCLNCVELRSARGAPMPRSPRGTGGRQTRGELLRILRVHPPRIRAAGRRLRRFTGSKGAGYVEEASGRLMPQRGTRRHEKAARTVFGESGRGTETRGLGGCSVETSLHSAFQPERLTDISQPRSGWNARRKRTQVLKGRGKGDVSNKTTRRSVRIAAQQRIP